MKAGSFTDTGYRFRKNVLHKKDFFVPNVDHGNYEFYDMQLFNSDTVNVPDDFMLIAEMYFRLNFSQVNLERKVFQLMDWLGAVGGIDTLLLKFSVFLFGSFAQFNSTFITISQSKKKN